MAKKKSEKHIRDPKKPKQRVREFSLPAISDALTHPCSVYEKMYYASLVIVYKSSPHHTLYMLRGNKKSIINTIHIREVRKNACEICI